MPSLRVGGGRADHGPAEAGHYRRPVRPRVPDLLKTTIRSGCSAESQTESAGGLEDAPQYAKEFSRRERLLNEVCPRLIRESTADVLLGVAAHQHHWQARALALN